jgi:DNA repair protein RadC
MLRSRDDAARWFRPLLQGRPVEEFHVLYVDMKKRVLLHERVGLGSDRAVVVEPRTLLKRAVELGARGFFVAHNHPSGDPEPSMEDLRLTHRLATAAHLLDIPLLDHLIVAGVTTTSLAERGSIPARET